LNSLCVIFKIKNGKLMRFHFFNVGKNLLLFFSDTSCRRFYNLSRIDLILRFICECRIVTRIERENALKKNRKGFGSATKILLALIGLLISAGPAISEKTRDWITGLPREPIQVKAWPRGKKVAVCFILYVEVWGFGHGPNFRPDMVARDPDVVDESFRQYAIEWGIPRVGRLFNEQGMPLSIALNALFPEKHPDLWKQFRSLVPKAPIIAHGINNSTELLPLGRGLDEQEAYIQRTLDLIEKDTGVRSRGWTSPSVYPNADTFRATAAAGITYSLDGMDSDILSRLTTKSGPLVLIPYPAVAVDMGQYLERLKQPSDMERLWIDYVTGLAREAEAHPDREATIVAIGIHPFVVGTPDGAEALRRVLENFKKQKLVWVTDVQAVLEAAGEKQ
jgi:peptidoglycan/xylan/chitin deacetylase (PgdA/CDA1 family)